MNREVEYAVGIRWKGRRPVRSSTAVIVIGDRTSLWAESPGEDLGAVETAFAATMADRDLDAFVGFLDDETVFFAGPTELRGAEAVNRRGRRSSRVRRRRSRGGPRWFRCSIPAHSV